MIWCDVQLQTLTRTGAASFFSQSLTNVFRVLCVAMIPIAAYAPSVDLFDETVLFDELRRV